MLRTNITDWDAEQLWRTYIQLSEAGGGVSHPQERTCDPAHLASARGPGTGSYPGLLSGLRLVEDAGAVESRAGLGNSPRTILEELGRIQSADVVLPLAEEPSHKLRIRCVVRPDKAQALLLERLGLRLPERLRPPPLISEM